MVKVGIAYSQYFSQLVEQYPDLIDYVEVPFEQLCHNAAVLTEMASRPIILHCASLSLAGSVLPSENTLSRLSHFIEQTRTPWLGEHLAFVLAEKSDAFPNAEDYAAGEPYNIGYTAAPPLNAESLIHVAKMVDKYAGQFKVPLIIENSPLYFATPGSTMSQTDFIRELCNKSDVGLLLDLTHFLITALNFGVDPFLDLARYPIDRVREIHVSGMERQSGIHWDNHAAAVPEEIFGLLDMALRSKSVNAVTLEYNWVSRFPKEKLVKQLERVRDVVSTHE
jgi:uncharacterized protein